MGFESPSSNRHWVPRVALVALLAAAGCDFFSNPGENPAAELRVITGDAQTAAAGTELPQPIVVRAMDVEGRGLTGQAVHFVVVAGGGGVSAETGTTDDSGFVSQRWTLGTQAGASQRLEVRVAGADEPSAVATFDATATTGPASRLNKVDGDGQVAAPGEQLPKPLSVRLTDRFGNPIEGATVTWSASSGSVSPGQAATSSNGIAQTTWRLGAAVGSYSATASSDGVEAVTFTAGTSLGGVTLTKTAGDSQAAQAGTQLPLELVVTLRGPSGAPIEGAWVRWTAAVDNGTGTPDSSQTNAVGEARARWTMPASTGPKTLAASVAGQAAVTFTATSQAGAAASVTPIGGNAQTGDVGAMLPESLAVVVRDAAGNPVSGATITWTVEAGGGAVSPVPSVTNAGGVAKVAWTLGLKADAPHIVQAAVAGITPASFTATPRIPATLVLAKTAGDNQTGLAGTALADSLEVMARLQDGRAVEGVRITWTTASGTIAPRGERTAQDGRMRARWTLGATSGTQQAWARWHNSAGAAADSVAFTATATAPPPPGSAPR